MQSNADKRLADLAIQNQALLERLKAGLFKDYDTVFPKVEAAIASTMAGARVQNLNELAKGKLDKLLLDLRSAQVQLYAKANTDLLEDLERVGGFAIGNEADGLNSLRGAAGLDDVDWTIPKSSATWKAVTSRPIQATGDLMKPFISKFTSKNMERAENAVRNGWAQGLTLGDVTRQIFGTKKNGYKDGITYMNRRGTQAMIRTATQHTAMTARSDFFNANDDLVQGYTYISTLDDRTTSICRSLDGKVFQMNEGPLPPQHVGCRSSITPKLGPEFDFLEEGATRSSANGYVDANTTYYDWLKGQNPDVVEDVLGKARAKLFLEGGMSADQFAKYNVTKNFKPLNLNELYAKNPAPFKKAGVRPRGVSEPLTPATEPFRLETVHSSVLQFDRDSLRGKSAAYWAKQFEGKDPTEVASTMKPITITKDGNVLTLQDGRHRLAEAERRGATAINARFIEYDETGGDRISTVEAVVPLRKPRDDAKPSPPKGSRN